MGWWNIPSWKSANRWLPDRVFKISVVKVNVLSRECYLTRLLLGMFVFVCFVVQSSDDWVLVSISKIEIVQVLLYSDKRCQ